MSQTQSADLYRLGDARARRRAIILVALGCALTLVGAWSLASGAVPVDLSAVFESDRDAVFQRTVLVEIRMPRVLLSLAVGASLAIAGAALQGLFRNPLADPGLIGVSSGAAVGAIAYIVIGAEFELPESVAPYALPVAAVIGASAVTLCLYLFSQRYGQFNILTMLLAGIAINAIAGVGIGAFQYISDDAQLRTLVFWMMGSFGRASWDILIPALAIMFAALLALLRQSEQLDRLQLGEDQARHLGIDVVRLKRNVVLLTAAVVGSGVALSGIIGFIGLVVPHLVRMLGGMSHRYVLPGAALLGATLATLADLIARTIVVPAEVPVGLVTSAIGGPFFLWLMTRVRPRAD
ncbi:MAG: iron ABC transporter permease [Pseudomonadota bacterium]